MSYCDVSDVLAVLPGLPQTTTASGYTATSAVISAHIPRADAYIDAKCARRYTVPFAATSTTTPPLIKSISADMTGWFCYRSLFTRDSVNRSEYLDDLYNHANRILDDILAGKIDVVDSAGSVLAQVNAGNKVWSNVVNYTPMFGPDDELNRKIDDGLLSEWRSRRQ